MAMDIGLREQVQRVQVGHEMSNKVDKNEEHKVAACMHHVFRGCISSPPKNMLLATKTGTFVYLSVPQCQFRFVALLAICHNLFGPS